MLVLKLWMDDARGVIRMLKYALKISGNPFVENRTGRI